MLFMSRLCYVYILLYLKFHYTYSHEHNLTLAQSVDPHPHPSQDQNSLNFYPIPNLDYFNPNDAYRQEPSAYYAGPYANLTTTTTSCPLTNNTHEYTSTPWDNQALYPYSDNPNICHIQQCDPWDNMIRYVPVSCGHAGAIPRNFQPCRRPPVNQCFNNHNGYLCCSYYMEQILNHVFNHFDKKRKKRQAEHNPKEGQQEGGGGSGDAEMLSHMIQEKLQYEYPGRTYEVLVAPADLVSKMQFSDNHMCKIRRECHIITAFASPNLPVLEADIPKTIAEGGSFDASPDGAGGGGGGQGDGAGGGGGGGQGDGAGGGGSSGENGQGNGNGDSGGDSNTNQGDGQGNGQGNSNSNSGDSNANSNSDSNTNADRGGDARNGQSNSANAPSNQANSQSNQASANQGNANQANANSQAQNQGQGAGFDQNGAAAAQQAAAQQAAAAQAQAQAAADATRAAAAADAARAAAAAGAGDPLSKLAAAAAAAGACFTRDTKVLTSEGEKSMEELEVGDYVMSSDLNYTKVIGWLHRVPDQEEEFIKLYLEDDRTLKVTPMHVLYKANCNENSTMYYVNEHSILAKNIKQGNCLFVANQIGYYVKISKVLKIERIIEKGIYAPETESGDIIVNNIIASCYTDLYSDALFDVFAQVYFHIAPLVFWLSHPEKSAYAKAVAIDIPIPLKFMLNMLDKPIPFKNTTQPVLEGTKFVIHGYLPENADGTRFIIEFRAREGNEDDHKIFHLNPRAMKVVSLNTYDDDEWGKEESCVYNFEIGRPFELEILIEKDYFQIDLNGQNLCNFNHRLDFKDIKHVFVDGEVRIKAISQTNQGGEAFDLLEGTELTTIDWEQTKGLHERFADKFEKTLPRDEDICKPDGRCRCKPGFVRHEGKCMPADRCKLTKLPELPTCPKTDTRFINYDVFKMHTRPDPTCETLDNFTVTDHCGPPGCQCYSPVFVRDSLGRCIPRWDCDKDLGYVIPECHNLKCEDNFTCEVSKIWKCWERTCFPMIACGQPGVDSHIFIFPDCDVITCPNGYECALKNASFSFREFEDVASETPICLKKVAKSVKSKE